MQYCEEKFARPGSCLYYALLKTSPTQRAALLGLHAFFQEIKTITLRCREPDIAQQKFLWWQSELLQLRAQTPQHPVTQLLLQAQKNFNVPTDALQTLFTAFLQDFHTPFYETTEALHQFYRQTSGTIEQLAGNLNGEHDQKIQEALSLLGQFQQIVTNLRDLHLFIHQGRSYIAGEMLLKHHVNLRELSEEQLTDAICNLLTNIATQARNTYGHAITMLPNKKPFLPTRILANIHKALLDELQRADFPVFNMHFSLTPLRKWWIAFRSSV